MWSGLLGFAIGWWGWSEDDGDMMKTGPFTDMWYYPTTLGLPLGQDGWGR